MSYILGVSFKFSDKHSHLIVTLSLPPNPDQLTKVSSDIQINEIIDARNTLIASGGKLGNTKELISVSCKRWIHNLLLRDKKYSIVFLHKHLFTEINITEFHISMSKV